MFQKRNLFFHLVAAGALSLLAVSCSWIPDDRTECSRRMQLEAQMKVATDDAPDADTFFDELETFRFYVFDAEGNYMVSQEESKDALKHDNYIVNLPIPPSAYEVVVWAFGNNSSYRIENLPSNGSTRSGLSLYLERDANGRQDSRLQPLWYGKQLVDNRNASDNIVLPMMRNTHTLVATLANEAPATRGMPEEEYTFEIVADNGYLNADNLPIPGNVVHYGAYRTEDTEGEMSTLRLIAGQEARFVARNKATGETVLDVELTGYLLRTRPLYEQAHGVKLTDQEYLDYIETFRVVFYYNPGTPEENTGNVLTALNINGWMIRLNDTEL